ncbi:AAA family ATPase [Paraburkholderia terrae]
MKLLEIPQPIIEDAIDQELAEEVVIADTVDDIPSVFLAPLYNAERSIVSQVQRLKSGSPPWSAFDVDKAIPWVEQKLAIQLADCQKQAIRLALSSKLLVITGGPGVGKTTLVNQFDTDDPACKTGEGAVVRANRTGGQAIVGIDRTGGEDDPPAA